MTTVWKVLLALALVVPMGAYVAGSLVASAADDPPARHTVQIREAGRTGDPSPSPTESPNHEVEVITPEYDDLGDDHGGDRHGGSDSGSGGSGSSGSGGSGSSGSGGSGSSGSGGSGSDDSGHGGGAD